VEDRSVTDRAVDLSKLRSALRRMSRGDLLILAGRATSLVPPSKLQALVGDFIRLEDLHTEQSEPPSLLDEVRRFHAESLRGEYYEAFCVTSKNCMESSRGTDAFIAEFDRLMKLCVHTARCERSAPVREAFELLFSLLRYIDECHDDVLFFADEGGSWQVGVDWRSALPAYFRCLAETASPEEFVREVERAITDFASIHRTYLLEEARLVAGVEEKKASQS
jgi:hypothetical protein